MSSKKERNDVGSGPGEGIDFEDKINAAMDKIMKDPEERKQQFPKGNTNRKTESMKPETTNQRKNTIPKMSTVRRMDMTQRQSMIPANMTKKDMMSRRKRMS